MTTTPRPMKRFVLGGALIGFLPGFIYAVVFCGGPWELLTVRGEGAMLITIFMLLSVQYGGSGAVVGALVGAVVAGIVGHFRRDEERRLSPCHQTTNYHNAKGWTIGGVVGNVN